MKRHFVVSLVGSFVGFGLLLILLGAAGMAGAQSAEVQADVPRPDEVSAATPLTSTFTYQGQLKNSGVVVNGSCQMIFLLYDDSAGGSVIGSPIIATVPVTNGLFTVGLNFGAAAFDGSGRWLDIQVDCGGGFVPLPRQAVTAAPYALFASNADLLDGQHASAFAGISHVHAGADITSGTVADARIAASIARDIEITPTILANDGSGSGLDADLLDGQHASAFVTLSGTQTISGVKTFAGGVNFADGTTQTTAFYRPALPGSGAAATVDSVGDVGLYPSVTIGADELGLISYWDNFYGQLKVLHCGNAACNSGNISTNVGYPGDVGEFTSITIGADGLGLISHFDTVISSDLKVLHCGNAVCNSGNISNTMVDNLGGVGRYTSITIGADGLGLISYHDAGNGDLKVLHCGNVACDSGNTVTTVDSAGNVGSYTSITIGADGLGLIGYHDQTNGDLKVLHCGNAACNSGNISTTVDSTNTVGYYTSITIGADGLGLISYYDVTNGDLKVLHCGNTACTGGGNTVTAVDTGGAGGDVGWYTSIAIGADGLGLISYTDFTNGDLKVVHCGNAACDSGNAITTLDSAGTVGWYTSITIGADGMGLISYYDATNGDLKVFRCSNLTCAPYPRVGR